MSRLFSYSLFALFSGVLACTPVQDAQSVAGNPAACVLDDLYIGQTPPWDLGNGIVAQETSLLTPLGGATISNVHDCRRGQEMPIWVASVDFADESQSYDHTDRFSVLAEQLYAMPIVSLGAIAAAADDLDMQVRPIRERRTPCGCEAFYPELVDAQRHVGGVSA